MNTGPPIEIPDEQRPKPKGGIASWFQKDDPRRKFCSSLRKGTIYPCTWTGQELEQLLRETNFGRDKKLYDKYMYYHPEGEVTCCRECGRPVGGHRYCFRMYLYRKVFGQRWRTQVAHSEWSNGY